MSTTLENLRKSICFGTKSGLHPDHGSKELKDLRFDVEEAFSQLEAHGRLPRIYKATGVVSNANGTTSLELTGMYFLAGRGIATKTVGSGNSAVTVSALKPGETGNTYKIQFTNSGANQLLSVQWNVVAKRVQVTLATDGNGVITSTATDVATAINATAIANTLMKATAGGTGLGLVAEVSETALAGGTGNGLTVYINGASVTLDDIVTNTVIKVKDANSVGIAVGAVVVVEVLSHTGMSNAVSLVVAA